MKKFTWNYTQQRAWRFTMYCIDAIDAVFDAKDKLSRLL